MTVKKKRSKKVFIICPVRNVDVVTKRIIAEYVQYLEHQVGAKVHWPSRDTDQNDSTGLYICEQNREAIFSADEIHIWYDPTSQGTIFDLGMLFAFRRSMKKKKIILINPLHLAEARTAHKSFANMLMALSMSKQ